MNEGLPLQNIYNLSVRYSSLNPLNVQYFGQPTEGAERLSKTREVAYLFLVPISKLAERAYWDDKNESR
jgi:hypothetical protein